MKNSKNNVHSIRYTVTAVQDYEMHYMNAWLKRCVFNLEFNRESVSEPQTLPGRLFQSLGAKYEKSSTSFSGFCYSRYYQEFSVLQP